MVSQGTEKTTAERAADSRLEPRLDGRRPDDRPDVFLARGRARWLRRCLDALGERPTAMIMLGWDRGSASSELFGNLHVKSLVAVDVAPDRSHDGALRSADGKATLVHVSDYRASESADLAYAHGVLDHMPEQARSAAAVLVYRSLSSGGLFAVWQRNPWSPSAMLSLREADGGSGRLTARDTRRLLRGVGFDLVHTTSPVFFPQSLSWCAPLEPVLAPIPIGGEYMVLARKP